MTRPLVTALIDTYNHERFIAQAIESVLAQDIGAREMEVLVVDDGSSDGTAAVVQKFAPRVRCLRKPNGGQASAFNAGIPEARGEMIAFLDGDDWWAEHKLRSVLQAFETNPDVGAVGHGYFEVNSGNNPFRVVTPEKCFKVRLINAQEGRLFSSIRGFFGTSKLTAKRSVLSRILPVPQGLVIEADEFIFTLAAALGSVLVLDEPLFYYRFHGGNLFQARAPDKEKKQRKERVLNLLLRELPGRLQEFGVPSEVIATIVEPIWVDTARIRLALEGGRRREVFRVEKSAYRLAYKEAGLAYRSFQALVLLLTLMLPPQRFYQFRQWYGDKNLRRLRRLTGEPISASPVVEQDIG